MRYRSRLAGASSVLMRSAVRQAIAWMVSSGLTPPTVGTPSRRKPKDCGCPSWWVSGLAAAQSDVPTLFQRWTAGNVSRQRRENWRSGK